MLAKGERQRVWACHEGVDLGARDGSDRQGLRVHPGRAQEAVGGWSREHDARGVFWDGESLNWHFRVPALRVNGGGAVTREEAERECLDAISFALEGDPNEYDSASHAVTLHVSVSAA